MDGITVSSSTLALISTRDRVFSDAPNTIVCNDMLQWIQWHVEKVLNLKIWKYYRLFNIGAKDFAKGRFFKSVIFFEKKNDTRTRNQYRPLRILYVK